MATKLFVGGISWNTKDDQLREFFTQAGNVVSATIINDRYTGRSKGFGFVEMSTEEEAKEAISKLNGQMLDGRALIVNEAKPQQPRDDRFSNRGGSGGGGSYGRRDNNRGFRGRDNRRGY